MQARQQLTKVIREGRTALLDGDGALAVEKSQHCATLAEDMKDVRAIRAVARLKASALRKVRLSYQVPCLKGDLYRWRGSDSVHLRVLNCEAGLHRRDLHSITLMKMSWV